MYFHDADNIVIPFGNLDVKTGAFVQKLYYYIFFSFSDATLMTSKSTVFATRCNNEATCPNWKISCKCWKRQKKIQGKWVRK